MKNKNFNVKNYWNRRYNSGFNSGSGSYGRLAEFKKHVINNFVKEKGIKTVIEFGCGDGNQLSLSNYERYIGFDISESSINICKEKFKNDKTKSFFKNEEYNSQKSDLSLSLDVIFHLVEEEIFNDYMKILFNSSNKFVIVYSSNLNCNDFNESFGNHVKHRKFTDKIDKNIWELIQHIPNDYPYDKNDPNNTSFSDFYIFKKNITSFTNIK